MDISCSSQTACSTQATDGCESDLESTSWGSPRPRARSCRTTSSRDLLRISGVGQRLSSGIFHLGNRCTTTPSCVRPARPARCVAFAHVFNEVSSAPSWRSESNTRSFMTPLLITKTMSSMVTDVSAMLVLRTTFRRPEGGASKTCCWSSGERFECSINGQRPRSPANLWYIPEISAQPERNTRTPPLHLSLKLSAVRWKRITSLLMSSWCTSFSPATASERKVLSEYCLPLVSSNRCESFSTVARCALSAFGSS
mmetsp:Transcript_85582/g.237192  ORF Transcript_85582/g.237192 Transcript_85582/m.237192 type:complete len:255 (-) Transcript_85582:262-1026(-)